MRKTSRAVRYAVIMAAGAASAAPAMAQTAGQTTGGSPLEEITVTARKREESIMRAPVLVEAVSAQEIKDLHITDIYSIQSAAPGLQMNTAVGTVGTSVYLRGLGNGQAANYIDQSVLLSIDGVGVSTGQFYRGGVFDLAQVEVLKGPQALFFGKSTSAGIISIHSADPTDEWDAKATVGYEWEADQLDLDGYISGPITDNLGVRLAAYSNNAEGYLYNPDPASSAPRLGDETADGVRLTLKYDNPDVGLRARLKSSYNRVDSNLTSGNGNQDVCSNGVSSVPYYDQFPEKCEIDKWVNGTPDSPPYVPDVVYPPFDPTPFATSWPSSVFEDGKPYQYSDTGLHVLELNYDFTPDLTLTSVTGYATSKVGEGTAAFQAATGIFGLGVRIDAEEFSQELRLTSDWEDSWFNFMIGALYNPSERDDRLAVPLPAFGIWTDNFVTLETDYSSYFGQILLTPFDKWELSAGVRHTRVEKHFDSIVSYNNYSIAFGFDTSGLEQVQNIPQENREFEETADTPEFTLSYRPTDDLTTFLSYKKGYKGPGFNLSLTDVFYGASSASPFGGEKAEGVEGGIKASLMDRRLALTLTGYRYDYDGLQVAIPQGITVIIRPEADARVQGIELGADFSPAAIEGLTLSAFANYNDTYYRRFTTAPCWGGQLESQGCVGGFQDLSGERVALAPEWVGNVRIGYETDLTDRYRLGMSLGGQYSSEYNVVAEQNPIGVQDSYFLLDAALRLTGGDGAWDLALLGRNLTNEYYGTSGVDRGVAGAPAGVPGDAGFYVARPRQIMLQLTVHANAF